MDKLPPIPVNPLNVPTEPGGNARWRGMVVGLVIGAVVSAAVTYSLVPKPKPAAITTNFWVEGSAVHLRKGASHPVKFITEPVKLGTRLAPAPVAARVTTLESRTAPSFAPLDGRVEKVAVRIGDRVKAGDKLVQVRSGDLATMRREVRAAKLAIETKKALVERHRKLVESRAGSRNDLAVAESELREATLTSHAAQAKLRSLTVKQDGDTSYWVLANHAGTVVQLDAVMGKQVGPDRDHPIATVADLEEVLIVADVPQKYAENLSPGLEVLLRKPGSQEEPVHGKVEVVSEMLDPDRQTVPIRIIAKNVGGKLRPHSFVEATFVPDPKEKILRVATEAVVSDGANTVVFIETSPGILQRRSVDIGRQTKEWTEIRAGVRDGEQVVVRGALLLLNTLEIQAAPIHG
jgi:membrane fusion protein, heavy metal efflux system